MAVNATFSDPVSIIQVRDFFGKTMSPCSLAETFTWVYDINPYGFQEAFTPFTDPRELREWRHYDHNYPSVDLDPVFFSSTDDQTKAGEFSFPISFSVDVFNNVGGRSYTASANWYINESADSYSVNQNTVNFATRSIIMPAGTGNGGTGTVTFANSLASNITFPSTGHSLTQDTDYSIFVIISNFSEGVWEVTNISTFALHLGHPPTPASIQYDSTQAFVVYDTGTVRGCIVTVLFRNSGDMSGTATVYSWVKDADGYGNYADHSVTIAGHSTASVQFSHAYITTHWDVGETLYLLIKDIGNYNQVSTTVITDELP